MRTSILMAALIAALSIIPLTARAANSVPKFDIAKNCKADLTVNTGSGETLKSCTRDEEAARDQLTPQWNTFRQEDKTFCIREAGLDGTPSYVELQTCLEMAAQRAPIKDKQ